MSDTHFLEILEMLKQIHLSNPDLRFGQVVQVALDEGKKSKNADLASVSSKQFKVHLDDFEAKTRNTRSELAKRRAAEIRARGKRV